MSLVITARPLPPPPDRVTALQFITALVVAPSSRMKPDGITPSPYRTARALSFITSEEAKAWIARNSLPASTLAAIAELPESMRLAAELGALGMNSISRTSPTLLAAMSIAQADENERDQLFRYAATLFPDP